jgi:hypothetical protein
MPKAKLTTRSETTSSTTSDTIPKGTGLSTAELDSNFLNLRDQAWRIRADDSTLHDVTADTQVTFSGGTITADAEGNITVSDLAGGGIGDLTVTGSTISSPSDGNLTLTSSGTGAVEIHDAHLIVSQPGSINAGQGEIARFQFNSGENQIDFNHNGNGGGTFNIYGPDGQAAGFEAPLQVKMSAPHMGCVIKLAGYNSGALPTGHSGYLIAIENNNYRPAYFDGSDWRYVHDNTTV